MKYSFESAFSPHIAGLVEQKRADGFNYSTEESLLKRFDSFCQERFPGIDKITRELVLEWSVIRPTEGRNYRNHRVGSVRQLSLYMLSLGIDAYVPNNYSKKSPKTVLYIPTREEMTMFFKELDTWESQQKRRQHFVDECRMMFLLYYCCGMRVSEARLLKKEHVDCQKGILTIYASKGQKDRLVYLAPDGVRAISEYLRHIEVVVPYSPWMFPGESPARPISLSTVENHFKACWAKLTFSANSNKHPTPHCLRHAFVVERLNDWMLRGIDTQQMIPYLSRYLGHKSPSETFYYYHLVKKTFAVIRGRDQVSKRVIPEVTPYEDD